MNRPEIDRNTAEAMLQDADFAEEHRRPTYADEPSTEDPDESVPTGLAGMEPEPSSGDKNSGGKNSSKTR